MRCNMMKSIKLTVKTARDIIYLDIKSLMSWFLRGTQTENTVSVTADEYVHAVELDGEFVFDDNCFSLLPDEKRTVTFRPISDAQSGRINVSGYTVKFC